jgi:hypothetical protein
MMYQIHREDFVFVLDENQARKARFIARFDDFGLIIPAFEVVELVPRR